jgi:hypothetical protein
MFNKKPVKVKLSYRKIYMALLIIDSFKVFLRSKPDFFKAFFRKITDNWTVNTVRF